MKKVFYFTLALMVSIGVYYVANNSVHNNTMEKLRDNHANLFKNHPYAKTLQMSKEERIAEGLAPDKYFEQEYLLEMNPKTGRTEPEKLLALQEELNNSNRNVPGTLDNMWEERGPRNVPGRTRAILFDPNDATNKRVFAGGVSGGLWVIDDITDGNASWTRVGIPENLAVSSITYDINDTQNFFIGTGESYVGGDVNGNGIWRSTDGGTTWEHVYGGSTGITYTNGDATLTVNTPASIAGEYLAIKAQFGAQATSTINSDLVLVDDGSGNNEGCGTLTNAAAINGHIAVVERGNCEFGTKVLKAENAGATAVIVINNVAGSPIIMAPGADGASVTIPSVMVSLTDGQTILTAMAAGTVNVDFDLDTDNDPAGTLVPGTFHINDIVTRDNGGATEIYAAVSDSYALGAIMGAGTFGVYKSTDNGGSWTKLTLPLTSNGNDYMPNNIKIASDNKVWVSTIKSFSYADGGGTIFSSSDGVNFTKKYTVPGDSDRTEIAVSSTDPNKIYVLAEHESLKVVLYKTTNGFTNTSSLPKPNDAGSGIPSNDFTRGQAFYDLMIEVDPNDDEIVYVGGIDVFRSPNGGTSWNQISKWTSGNGQPSNIPQIHADQHALVFNPSDSDIAVLGTDGGVFYASSLAGATSSPSAIQTRKWDYNTTQFYKGAIGQNVSNERLLAGAQDNGTYLKTNATAGVNLFSRMQSGDGMYCFIDKDEQYTIASFYNNNFNRYGISGGYQATLISETTGLFVNPADLDDNLNILYTCASTSTANKIAVILNADGSPFKLYITNAMLLGVPTVLKVSPYTSASTTLFAGTSRGNLFKIENANASSSWTKITGPDFFGTISAINFGTNEDEIMVTFHNYGVDSIWYTDDGGSSWQNKEGDFPDIPVKDIMMNPLLNSEVMIATDLGVWYTQNFFDASPNWVRAQNDMQNVKVTSFDLRTADNKVLASTYGRGLFSGFFTSTPSSGINENVLDKSISVYPTLVNSGYINIESSKQFGVTKVSIYDTQGKIVMKRVIELNNDKKTLDIDLVSGIYFVKLNTSGLETTKKIIVQ